jgi:hypothetical protein
VETGGRAGTTVSSAGDPTRARLREAAERYAALVRELGVAPREGLTFVRTALSVDELSVDE